MYETVYPFYEAEVKFRREQARRGIVVRRQLRRLQHDRRRPIDVDTLR